LHDVQFVKLTVHESPAIIPAFVFGLKHTWLAVHKIRQAPALKPVVAFMAAAEVGRVVCSMRDINESLDRFSHLVPADARRLLSNRADC
jgi:hypothetical protein